MVKRATSSKAVSKRSASGKKAKCRCGAKTVKKRTAKSSSGKTAKAKVRVKAARGATTAKRTKAGASGRAASGKLKKAAKKPKSGKRRLVRRRPASKTATSKVGPPAASQGSIQPRQERKPRLKTYLTAKQLAEFRRLLLSKRAELAGDVQHLTHDAFDRKGQERGGRSAMPIHMADIGSDNWEQEFTLGLIENEQALIREIDEALARIDDRTYGMCVATHEEISLARLRAKPWAKYCIACARAREEGRAP